MQRATTCLPPACVLPAGLVLHESAPDPWSTLQEFCVIPPICVTSCNTIEGNKPLELSGRS